MWAAGSKQDIVSIQYEYLVHRVTFYVRRSPEQNYFLNNMSQFDEVAFTAPKLIRQIT
jgi:hypothetical protein